jgi:serine protease DegQ
VLSINGKEIRDTATLITETAAVAPGTRAAFKVLRGGRETMSVPVEVGQRPALRKPS